MLNRYLALGLLLLACVLLSRGLAAEPEKKMLTSHTRTRVPAADARKDTPPMAVEKTVEWDPRHTALIVCDMWDDHWCKSAAGAWPRWPGR